MANETLDEKKEETPPVQEKSEEKKDEKIEHELEETKAEDKNESEEDSGDEIGTPTNKKDTEPADSSAEKKDKDPVTPTTDRPTRERKVVERYSAPSTARSNTPKAVSIEKGSGTQLRDIPNVAFKLSKRKPDDNLQILHTILFGKKAKAHSLKKNIGQFSGFVWAENELEKQKSKLKEKLDKCVKDKLLDFCDVLNIPVNRAAIKKEELSVKLLEFLESPHVTTDVLLAEKEQKGKKRKATPSKKASAGESSDGKKRKQTPQTKEKQKDVSKTEEEDDENDEKVDLPDNMDEDHDADVAPPKEESDDEETKSEEEKEDETKEQKSVKKSSAEKNVKEAKSKEKPTTGKKKNAAGSSSKKSSADADEKAKSKTTVSKKQKVEKETKEKSVPSKDKASGKKQSTKSQPTVPKNQGKAKKKVKEPTREEMHAVVVSILKEVDFNTATLSDILRQLGTHFGVDLLPRKAEVKEIITEVINNMSDEEEEEDDNEGAEDDTEAKDKDGEDDA